MEQREIKGIVTALATPFWKGELDKKSLVTLIHSQLEQKLSGLVINGTTGESPCLTPQEVEQIFSIARVECAGAMSLILGVGGNSTKTVLHNIVQAEKWGADAVLAVTPYYNKPPQRGLVQHFAHLATSTQLPVILYNVPSRTVVDLSLESLKTLSQYSNIATIKEASGDMVFGRKVIQQNRMDGSKWQVLSGDDESCMELIALGATGGICVISHILGAQMQQLLQSIRAGHRQPVKDYQQKYSALLQAIYCETNPIGIKMALKLMGIFRSAEMRSPLVSFTEERTQTLKRQLKKAGLL